MSVCQRCGKEGTEACCDGKWVTTSPRTLLPVCCTVPVLDQCFRQGHWPGWSNALARRDGQRGDPSLCKREGKAEIYQTCKRSIRSIRYLWEGVMSLPSLCSCAFDLCKGLSFGNLCLKTFACRGRAKQAHHMECDKEWHSSLNPLVGKSLPCSLTV